MVSFICSLAGGSLIGLGGSRVVVLNPDLEVTSSVQHRWQEKPGRRVAVATGAAGRVGAGVGSTAWRGGLLPAGWRSYSLWHTEHSPKVELPWNCQQSRHDVIRLLSSGWVGGWLSGFDGGNSFVVHCTCLSGAQLWVLSGSWTTARAEMVLCSDSVGHLSVASLHLHPWPRYCQFRQLDLRIMAHRGPEDLHVSNRTTDGAGRDA